MGEVGCTNVSFPLIPLRRANDIVTEHHPPFEPRVRALGLFHVACVERPDLLGARFLSDQGVQILLSHQLLELDGDRARALHRTRHPCL